MDNGTLIYIVLTIVFFIFNALTKKKKPTGDEATGEQGLPADEQPRKKPTTFEELLREIRQGQQKEELEEEEANQQEVYEYHPPVEKPSYEKLEKVPEPKRRQPEIQYYEGTYQADHTEKGKSLVKLDDQVKINSDEQILKEVEDVAEESASYNRYRRMLKDPQSLRDAVVVSEILKRKTF
ncbi:hypothetical protein [Echinicola sp. 20G]|uniref:hypothetical protein n=1 Tax=Echinicola sp. 20G TaxID=2781961 RepID=UPI001910113B|nr:hypothetical protein [Echinicola sp. 20G]